MEIKKLLELRNKRKKAKPRFVERESHLYPRIKARWRFPRGTSSAIRRRKRGEPQLVSIGYGSPKEVKDLHSSGLEKVMVSNAKELMLINPKTQGAVISATVGNKKRIVLLQTAKDKGIKVLNIKNVEKFIEEVKTAFADRKKSKEEKLKDKDKKLVEKKKKQEEKQKKEEEEKKKGENAEEAPEALPEEKIKKEQQELKEAVEKTIIKRQ